MKAMDVANYIIAKSDNVGDLITNKKLQKVLYYVKAWGLVYFLRDGGVIDEPFEAWVHGPVCPEVYRAFKVFGYGPLKLDYQDGISSSEYIANFAREHEREKNKVDLINAVFDKYAGLSSLQLELLSHSETPWIEARKGLVPIERGNNVISDQTMIDYYSARQ